jgi:hypothetical protein
VTYKLEGHVNQGSQLQTQFISTTRDLNVALRYAARDGLSIVRIDLSQVGAPIYDLSDAVVRESLLKGVTARRFAKASSEVVVEGNIPAAAVQYLYEY